MTRLIPPSLLRLGFILLIASSFSACTTALQKHQTQISLLASAGSPADQQTTLAKSLARAQQILQTGLSAPEQQQAYNQAVEDAVILWLAHSKQDQHQRLVDVNTSQQPYQIQASWSKKLRFDQLIPASTIKRKSLRQNFHRPGAGAAFVAQWKHTEERAAEEPFMSSKGYFAPVTATLDFSPGQSGKTIARLVLHNPKTEEKVRLARQSYTLQYDQSATAEHLLAHKSEFSALGALFSPHKYLDQISLQTISPPDPDRLPVIFTHGLASEPRTWQNVYNELRTDPFIREKCQIYFFRYPSGVPVLYSAAHLREKLSILQDTLNQQPGNRYGKQMLLVGHSMGGLITKSQVQTSEESTWFNFIDDSRRKVKLNQQQLEALQHFLVFKPNPNISRVVFIATPHRGSELADFWLAKQLRKLISMPITIVRAPLAALDQDKTDSITNQQIEELFESGIPTSMQNLSPQSKFVTYSIKLPLKNDLKIHSIVGNLKGLDLNDPKCSDGVVPYTSAHLGVADSELIVPYGHSAHEHPLAIKEIRRIMKLHLNNLR